MLYINDSLFEFDLDKAIDSLPAFRREQALRFTFELGRRTCAAVYLLLCQGLQNEYGITDLPVFGYGEHGKPYILDHEDIHFNLSHCREAAACYISSKPVGIDIETIHPLKKSLMEYTMNHDEQQHILASYDPGRAFTRLWTRKEAVLKLIGTGINNNLKEVLLQHDVSLQTVETPNYIYSFCQFSL